MRIAEETDNFKKARRIVASRSGHALTGKPAFPLPGVHPTFMRPYVGQILIAAVAGMSMRMDA